MDDVHRQRLNIRTSLAANAEYIRTRSERLARIGHDRASRTVEDLKRNVAGARSHHLFLLGMLRGLESA
jgi:hypothetical protein